MSSTRSPSPHCVRTRHEMSRMRPVRLRGARSSALPPPHARQLTGPWRKESVRWDPYMASLPAISCCLRSVASNTVRSAHTLPIAALGLATRVSRRPAGCGERECRPSLYSTSITNDVDVCAGCRNPRGAVSSAWHRRVDVNAHVRPLRLGPKKKHATD